MSPGLRVIERVAVELLLGLSELISAVEILALGHELQRERRASHRPAAVPGDRAHDEGVADAEMIEHAAHGGGSRLLERGAPCRRRALNVLGLDHMMVPTSR
jgi:hypothetical protein